MTSCTNKLIAINASGQLFGQAWPFTFMQTGYPGSPETPVGITVNNKGTIYASTHECPDIPGGVPAHFYSLQPGGTNTSNWPVSSHAMYWPAAVANDGTIFQMDEYAQISAYSPQGQALWSVGTSGYGQGDIALDAAGNVYAGTDGNLYGGHTVYSFTPSGVLRTNWPQDTAGVSAPTTPVIGPDGGIYIANSNGSLYAFNGDGSIRKGFPFVAGGTVSQQPLAVSSAGIVYMKTSLGLFAIKSDGTSVWSKPFSPGGDVSLSPGPILDSNGFVYVGFGNSVYSLNPDGSQRNGWPVTVQSVGPILLGGSGIIYAVSNGQKVYSITNSSGTTTLSTGVDLSQLPTSWAPIVSLYDPTVVVAAGWGGGPKPYQDAQQILSTAPAGSTKGVYSLLNYDLNTTGGYSNPGAYQVGEAVGTVSTEALSLRFLAVDVEQIEPLPNDATSVRHRNTLIAQAIQAVLDTGQNLGINLLPVIYTTRYLWPQVTGGTNGTSSFGCVPLWDAWFDGVADLRNNGPDLDATSPVSNAVTKPWTPYGGWTSRMGKQYTNTTSLGVDLDVFNPALFLASSVSTIASDVTAKVTLQLSGFRYNFGTHLWGQTITITNNSGTSIPGPLAITLDNLSNGATLSTPSPSGITSCTFPNGSLYTTISQGTLYPGQSANITLQFTLTQGGITYTPRILSGSGTR
jgi:hypothetical protein